MQIIISTILLLLMSAQNVFTRGKDGDWCVIEKSNTIGRCIAPQRCDSANFDFMKYGIRPTFCEYSLRRVLICCRGGQQTPSQIKFKDQTPIVRSKGLETEKRVCEIKCAEYSRELPVVAGRYVYGGQDADQGEFPHMGAIGWLNLNGEYEFSCGGSLISPRFVLTAGHCTKKAREINPTPVIVRLGDINLDPNVNKEINPVDVRIKAIHKHPDYQPPKRYNDIALLELEAGVQFTAYISPACLWTKPDLGGYERAKATGWGLRTNVTRETSKVLQKVWLTLYSNEHCDRILNRSRYWGGFVSSQMCAGELSGGKDTCQGDSGAPLQVSLPETYRVYHIMGLTSFGGKCAQKGQPAIYTRVSSYLDWIESVVWPELF